MYYAHSFKELRAHALQPRVDIDLEDWGSINAWFERCIAALPALAQSGAWSVRDDYLSRLAPPKPPKRDGFDRNRPFPAQVTVKRNLTTASTDSKDAKSKGEDKETLHIEFDLADSKLEYSPGTNTPHPHHSLTSYHLLFSVTQIFVLM
jgi:sulfite reductase alpha subunit-like flavoprotein